MSLKSIRPIVVCAALILVLGAAVLFWFSHAKPVRAEDLEGEWVQDPDFLQFAGSDLDSQKREIDRWENYEFAFRGQNMTAWHLLYDESRKDFAGWAQGEGTYFHSEFTLGLTKGGTLLKFTDQQKLAREARLTWEGPKLAVAMGDRKFRLMKQPAPNLRTRGLIAGQK